MAALQIAAMMSRPETETESTSSIASGTNSDAFVPEETLEHEPEFRKIMEVVLYSLYYCTIVPYEYLYRLPQNSILFAPGFWRGSPDAACTNSATGSRYSLESERQMQAIYAGANHIRVYFMNYTWNETCVLECRAI